MADLSRHSTAHLLIRSEDRFDFGISALALMVGSGVRGASGGGSCNINDHAAGCDSMMVITMMTHTEKAMYRRNLVMVTVLAYYKSLPFYSLLI
ncbi:Hypothetical predicted protein [Octopus vulgaris]|uniref:Uncharacterized protein n=1 Tax=Octopus vulgaris TaxID=6645 RepID=A0AA36F4Q3_OCTVU|nr:Hypothetical predicted protein [Octopus vulgaris]